jgi:hypothetical protein
VRSRLGFNATNGRHTVDGPVERRHRVHA